MATDILRLTPAGRPLIGEAFLKGEREFSVNDLRPYLESTGISVELSPIDDKVDEIMGRGEYSDPKYKRYDHEIDAELAPVIHEVLDLSRRQASDPGIWHYLAVIEYSTLVRYRWRYTGEDAMEEKFLKAGADIYSNAIHRLWWIAELTYDEGREDPYDRTTRVLKFQELANDIFDRWFSRYRPMAVACSDLLDKSVIDEFEPASSTIVSDTTTRLREELTVRRLEAMSNEQIEEMITDTREDVIATLLAGG